jgi:hypothetical protein
VAIVFYQAFESRDAYRRLCRCRDRTLKTSQCGQPGEQAAWGYTYSDVTCSPGAARFVMAKCGELESRVAPRQDFAIVAELWLRSGLQFVSRFALDGILKKGEPGAIPELVVPDVQASVIPTAAGTPASCHDPASFKEC